LKTLRLSSESQSSRRGMILIVVTVVLLMISLAGFGFVAVMYTENKAAHLTVDELHVQNAAASGAELLKGFLAQSPSQQAAMGGLFHNSERFQGQVLFARPGANNTVRFTVLSPQIEDGQYIGVRYGAENESARLNLSVLAAWDKAAPESGRKALMQLPGMTDEVADSIMDWLDADNESRSNGAESDYYSGLEPPYETRNGPIESLEELLLVKGVTRELLFGADTNRNYVVEEQEADSVAGGLGGGSNEARLPWAAYLTIYSRERNAQPNGRPRVNVNLSSAGELQRQLSGSLDDNWMRFIIAYRQNGPYTGSEEGQPVSTLPLDLSQPLKYKIASVLDLIGARVAVTSPSGSSQTVYVSPLTDQPDSLRQSLPALMDAVTTDPQPVIPGRVNINQAPREVIAAIPGLPETLPEQIIAGRGLQDGEADPERRYPTWLLTSGLVDLPTLRTLLPFMTCGGDVYRAQVVGYFDHGTPAARGEVVIDAIGPRPREVYYKDRRILGRGFSLEILRGEPLTDLPSTAPADSADVE